MVRVEHGIAWAGVAHAAHVGDEVAHFAGFELLGRLVPQLQVPDLVHLVDVLLVRAEGDLHARPDGAVHDADAGDRAAVTIVVGVEDEGTERRVRHATGRRDALHHGLEQLGHPGALLGGEAEDLLGLRPDQLMQLLRPSVRLGSGEVDLVEHGDDLQPGVHREEQVGKRLRLDSLRRVHHEDRPLARL